MLKFLNVFLVLLCVCSVVDLIISLLFMKEKISNQTYTKIRNVILCILFSNIVAIIVCTAIDPLLVTLEENIFKVGALCVFGLQIMLFECSVTSEFSKMRLSYVMQALICFIFCNILTIFSLIY